jgi:hypothetical protein
MLDRRGNDDTLAVSKLRIFIGAHNCLQVPIIAYRSLLDHWLRVSSKDQLPLNRQVKRVIPDGDVSDVIKQSK